MAPSIFAFLSLLTMIVSATAQEGVEPPNVKRCMPKAVKHGSLPKHLTVGPQKGEKATGYSPLISFQVLESGNVADAHVKRSSGFADIDTYALEWIQGTKYNARSGCGVIETEASVSIHWTPGK